MTQIYLGTIGWIKSNLMSSSQASNKYNNDNFYPGSQNIPESEPKEKYYPIQFISRGKQNGINGNIANTNSSDHAYELQNTPDFSTLDNWEIGFTGEWKANGGTNKGYSLFFCPIGHSVSLPEYYQGFFLSGYSAQETLSVYTEHAFAKYTSTPGINTQPYGTKECRITYQKDVGFTYK